MKFRVYEVLDDKREYTKDGLVVVGKEIRKKVDVYGPDGDISYRAYVYKDNNGNEYFYVQNPNDEDGLFFGRIKDAVESIRSGNGDCIEISSFFGHSEDVVCMIDRELGEKYRAKCIEGFKDAVFKYALKAGSGYSFGGRRFINTNIQAYMGKAFDKNEEILLFDTEKEAQEKANEIISTGIEYGKKYSENEGNETVQEEICNEIDSKYNLTIYQDIFFAYGTEEQGPDVAKNYIKVVQVIA